MATYLIVDGIVHNPEGYEAYKLKARPAVEMYGGEYLARGGELDVKENDLWTPTRVVLIRFPDMASAQRFYNSPEYQAVLPISKANAKRTVFFVEGM